MRLAAAPTPALPGTRPGVGRPAAASGRIGAQHREARAPLGRSQLGAGRRVRRGSSEIRGADECHLGTLDCDRNTVEQTSLAFYDNALAGRDPGPYCGAPVGDLHALDSAPLGRVVGPDHEDGAAPLVLMKGSCRNGHGLDALVEGNAHAGILPRPESVVLIRH